MLLHQAQEILRGSGYRFLKGHIIKNNMTYGFYSSDTHPHYGVYATEQIWEVRTCSREVAALMVVNNVKVIKY